MLSILDGPFRSRATGLISAGVIAWHSPCTPRKKRANGLELMAAPCNDISKLERVRTSSSRTRDSIDERPIRAY